MRKTFLLTASAFCASAVTLSAFARDYDMSNLPYSDAPSDIPTAVAISVLTDANVLEGDPGGTIRPSSTLNRAEFMKIVMSLMPANDPTAFNASCFPDVAANMWYTPFVCRAKQLGIVSGHAQEGVPQSQWLFKPNDPVQYEEAVKILVEMYALPTERSGVWYEPYIRAAQANDLAISGLRPGDRIRRGEMARLVVGFLAYNEGELAVLRNAERGIWQSSSSSSVSSGTGSSLSSSSVSSSASSMSSTSSASSTSWSNGYDPMADTAIRSNFFVLGETSPIVGAVNLFSNNEPLDVTRVRVSLFDSTSTVDSFLVYDQDRRLLGRATLDTSVAGEKQYVLRLNQGVLQLPRRENMTVYVRASVKSNDLGGQSGQSVRIASFGIEGTGSWSNDAYNQNYSDTFPTFETARAKISAIENAGPQTGNIVSGPNQQIGAFRFRGQGDSQGLNDLRTTSITFTVDAPSGVTLSNAYLKREAGDTQLPCTVSSGTVTCSGIPASIGSIKGEPALYLYADVSLSGVLNPTLRVNISNPGTPTSPGAVTWTDGQATFDWLPFDTPVVRGTDWR